MTDRSTDDFIITEEVNCLFCGSANKRQLFESFDRAHGVPGIYGVVRCEECGFIYTSPRPVLGDLPKCYPTASYFHFREGGSDDSRDDNVSALPGEKKYKNDLRKILLRKCFGYRFEGESSRPGIPSAFNGIAGKFLTRFPSFRIPLFVDQGKLLEVGFGSGDALGRMRELGWRISGSDLNEEACRIAREKLMIDIVDSDGSHLNAPDGSFDAIMLFHTCEHLPDPLGALREYARLLKPGGQLLLEVPNFHCLQSACFRNRWRGLEVPRHLSHFTKQNLTDIVGKAGFVNVRTRPVVASPVNVFCPSLPPKIENDRFHYRKIWSRSRMITTAVYLLGPAVGLGDSLFLTARRRK